MRIDRIGAEIRQNVMSIFVNREDCLIREIMEKDM